MVWQLTTSNFITSIRACSRHPIAPKDGGDALTTGTLKLAGSTLTCTFKLLTLTGNNAVASVIHNTSVNYIKVAVVASYHAVDKIAAPLKWLLYSIRKRRNAQPLLRYIYIYTIFLDFIFFFCCASLTL